MNIAGEKLKATLISAVGLGFYVIASNLLSAAAIAGANLLRYGKLSLAAGALSGLPAAAAEIAIVIISFGGAVLIISRGLPDRNFFERPRPGGTVVLFALFFASLYVGSYLSSIAKLAFAGVGVSWADVALPDLTGTGSAAIIFLRYALLPAVFEELLFRGALLRRLLPLGERGACIAVSVIFTLFHYNAAQWPAIFLLGFSITYAAIKSGSIILPVIMHLINNTLVLVQSYSIYLGYESVVRASSLLIVALGVGGGVFYLSARRSIPGAGLAKGACGAPGILISPLLIYIIFGVACTALSAVIQ